MAHVPEINSILMDNYSETEEDLYGGCPREIKNSLQDFHCGSCPKNCSTCSSGIKLEITEQRQSSRTFRKTVVLVVAVEKMKKKTDSRKLFMDMDLLDLLNNIFVEDEIPFETFEFEHSSNTTYRYSTSKVFNIKDTSNKCFALQEFPGNARLVALQLQGMNIQREVKLNMAFYSTKPFYGGRRRPVALGIMGKNVYLSCVSAEGAPELRLESVSNIQSIKNDDLLRFIFLKSENGPNGTSTSSFESAMFSDWYISTSQSENELVQMVHQHEQRYITEFSLLQDM
ncbi:interleukin-1 beta-like [Ascaphus truei]|uniref:interleukin-1 beta-like n=1 Tax=Ascaphus truei TaxID=8439 RepID=UPI003F5A6E08